MLVRVRCRSRPRRQPTASTRPSAPRLMLTRIRSDRISLPQLPVLWRWRAVEHESCWKGVESAWKPRGVVWEGVRMDGCGLLGVE